MANRIEQEIVVKVVGGKDVGALQKQIKALEKEKATLLVNVDVDDDDARKKLDALDKEIAELKGEKAEIEVTAKVDRAIDALDEVAAEAKKAEVAAEALSVALGPDLAGKADLDSIISDFNRMGLSMDDITANADKLGAKLREVGSKDVGGRITTGFRRAGDELRSAGGSASVFANAIGNSVQDLGAVAGLSGTAGVAIGQMGEYMADARLQGEGLRTVLANFGKVAGPVAALFAAMQVVTAVMGAHQESAEAAAAATDELAEAMDSAVDPALGLAQNLQGVVDRFHEFDTQDAGFWTDVVHGIEDVAGAVPGLGSALGAAGVDVNNLAGAVSDVIPTLEAASISAYDVGQAIAGTSLQWSKDLRDAFDAGIITAEQYSAAFQAIVHEQELAAASAKDDSFFQVTLEQAKALGDEVKAAQDPLSVYTDQWGTLLDDLRDGRLDTQAAADAIQFLSEKLNMPPGDVYKLAVGAIGDEVKELAKAQEEAEKAAKDWAKAQQDAANDAADAFADAQMAIDDMASGFSIMERNEEAIGRAFDLGNAPLEALEAVVDINDAIRDLGKFIEDNKGVVPNIFNPNDVDAGPFLAKIESLRSPIQQAVSDAFSAGGPAAATATADAYVEQITKSMRGKLTKDQVRTLLALDDLEATLTIAVDQASLATATQMLEILTGLQGDTPWTATVQLALAAGEITPDTARILIADQLENLGVPVPTVLEEPTEGSKTSAKAAADRFAAQNPVDMQTLVGDPKLAELIRARNAGQDDADRLPIVFPSTVAPPRLSGFGGFRNPFGFNDGGNPSVPYPGGIAGERGPEIINDRYLTTGPTFVPPGTKVTSRRRTAVILRQHSNRNLRRYDSGGMVPSGPITVNVNAGVVGNRFDVMRAVHRANLDKIRLRGSRG